MIHNELLLRETISRLSAGIPDHLKQDWLDILDLISDYQTINKRLDYLEDKVEDQKGIIDMMNGGVDDLIHDLDGIRAKYEAEFQDVQNHIKSVLDRLKLDITELKMEYDYLITVG